MSETRKLSVEEWCRLAQEGIEIPMTITLRGASMEPMIRYMRDPVTIIPVHRQLIPGDVVMFLRADGAHVVHRLYRILDDGKKAQTWGDNCEGPDQVIPMDSSLGLAVSYERDGVTHMLDTDEQRQNGLRWIESRYRRGAWFTYRKMRDKAEKVFHKIKGI